MPTTTKKKALAARPPPTTTVVVTLVSLVDKNAEGKSSSGSSSWWEQYSTTIPGTKKCIITVSAFRVLLVGFPPTFAFDLTRFQLPVDRPHKRKRTKWTGRSAASRLVGPMTGWNRFPFLLLFSHLEKSSKLEKRQNEKPGHVVGGFLCFP